MPWREANALHIFAPVEPPFNKDNWVEQILGTTVTPINDQYGDHIRWLWVTRYSDPYNEESPPLNCILPEKFRSDGNYRYIVFRLSVSNDVETQLQEEAILLAQNAGCFTYPDGWIEYNVVEDLGSIRFVYESANQETRNRRALLVSRFVDSTVRLMLDSLILVDNNTWRQEPNSLTKENPNGSFLESVRHLFSNATNVPTTVILKKQDNQLQFGTFWMEPITIDLNTSGNFDWMQIPIRY